MSIEAMAMAGMDYKECDINLEEWETHYQEQPPLYLLVERDELVNVAAKLIIMKAKIREWAKAVASSSKQERVTNDKCKVHIFS